MAELLVAGLQFATAWLLAALLASLALSIAYPAFRALIGDCDPSMRAIARWLYGLAAPAVAALVAVLLMHPELSAVLVPGHCHQGDCTSHAPLFSVGSLGGMSLVASCALAALAAIVFGVRPVYAAQRRLAALLQLSRGARSQRFRLIESSEPLAWCCGYFRPRVVISRGLAEQLSPAELDAVLLHEEQHAARYDNLRMAFLSWSTAFWPTPLRMRILADLDADAEQACDAATAFRLGNGELVASALRTLAFESAGMFRPRAAAFLASGTAARLAALARPLAARRSSASAWAAVWLAWVLPVTLFTGLAHLVVEWVVAIGT